MLPRNIFIPNKSLKDTSVKVADEVFILLYVGEGNYRQFAVRKREFQNQFVEKMLLPSVCSSSIKRHSANYAKSFFWENFFANAESNTAFQYCLRNVCCPLLDHFIIHGIETRFEKYDSTVHLMYGLIPFPGVERDTAVKDITRWYQEDLSMPFNAEETFFQWKRRWESVSKNERPSVIASPLKACDHDMYLEFHVLLRICATVPVTSYQSKQSGSVLTRLHIYLRAWMGQVT